MENCISLVCNDCKEHFDVEMGIGLSMVAFHEDFGDSILCRVCFPEEPYEKEAVCNDNQNQAN